MRIKRAKSYKKHIKFYRTNFGFQEPYEVIVDGNFFQYCAKVKFDVKEMLMKILAGIITECIFQELLSLESSLSEGTIEAAKKYKKDPCVHAGTASAKDCIMKLIGVKNSKKYFLATQDESLRILAREIPCVPLIYFKHNIMTFDPPTEATKVKALRKEKMKFKPEPSEKNSIKDKLQTVYQEEIEKKVEKREYIVKNKERNKMKIELGKKRKANGPNPLSCKKKAKVSESQISQIDTQKKTRRKRKSKPEEDKTISDN